jgi:hypothetical protein
MGGSMIDEDDADVRFLRDLHFLSVEDALIALQEYSKNAMLETKEKTQDHRCPFLTLLNKRLTIDDGGQ